MSHVMRRWGRDQQACRPGFNLSQGELIYWVTRMISDGAIQIWRINGSTDG
jgi:hypothetical protein